MRQLFHVLASLLSAALLSAAAPCAVANTLGFHIASQHIPERNYNNTNPGVYYRLDSGWTGGFYNNSLRKTSVYAGYTWKLGPLDVTGALATGYLNAVQPLLVPSVALFTVNGITPRLAFIPRVEKRLGVNVLHLMVEY